MKLEHGFLCEHAHCLEGFHTPLQYGKSHSSFLPQTTVLEGRPLVHRYLIYRRGQFYVCSECWKTAATV